jgi:hypothetical protein
MDTFEPGQYNLDLTQFDAVSADFDLMIHAAEVLDISIG